MNRLAKNIFSLRFYLIMALIGLPGVLSFASGKTTTPEKLEAIIQASYKKSGNDKTANVNVTAKRKDRKVIVPENLLIKFYVKDHNELKFLDKAYTDEKGNASIKLPGDLPLDDTRFFNITAKIENDSLYENAEDNIHVKEATLNLKLNQVDTSNLVVAKVTEHDASGMEVPVKDVEIKFYVQRLFGVLSAGEDYTVVTNEQGEAPFNYPKNISGDYSGNITVVARIVDNDQYGNMECKTDAKWGVPLAVEKDPFPRALWEPTAPPQLILTFCTLFAGIWFTYFFVFSQLSKINSEKKIESQIE